MKKKLLNYLILIFISFMFWKTNVLAEELSFCVQTSSIWQFVGYLVLALKIIIPIIIIVLATVDFAKAVINNKDDELSSAGKGLLIRIILGIVIFLIPSIVSVIFNMVKLASDSVKAGEACEKCLNNPNDSQCESYKTQAKQARING